MSDVIITSLAPNEVFVYGANSSGFSGAGSAGLAVRGTAANTWRTDPWVARARNTPVGHPDRIGKWGVWGISRGWSKGKEGMGYAIETIRHPGQLRSIPLVEIQEQIVGLCVFAREHPEWTFLLTAVGSRYAGYSGNEMTDTLCAALVQASGCPTNLVIPPDLYENA